MADLFELSAEVRDDKGKAAARRMRRNADMVPGILYGAGRDPQPLSIAHKDLHKACEDEGFFSRIIKIKADGKVQEAILKDLQRHPAKDRILHVDFQRIQMDQAITSQVPLHFLNEDNCVGVKQEGGVISHNLSSLTITCLPGDLPEFIEVDVRELALGGSIHMSELNMPNGVTIPSLAQGADHDHVVVSVHAPRREEVIEEAPEEAVEGEEGEAAPEADAEEGGEAKKDDE